MKPVYDQNNIAIYSGDLLQVLPEFPANSFDSCVTDAPYGFFFLGQDWDHGVPGARYWEAIKRVCKPGAMLLAFGGARTYHRLACAIEDAGWEIRDCLMWLYGTGFPKSLDIGKAFDKAAGAEREVVGVSSVTGGRQSKFAEIRHDSPSGFYGDGKVNYATAPATDMAKLWDGFGTALKPSFEPVILAMKPLDGTFIANAKKYGVAGLNIDAARIDTFTPGEFEKLRARADAPRQDFTGELLHSGVEYTSREIPTGMKPGGRWPANLLLDEKAATILDEQGHGASRFFYVAKASKKDRGQGNDHPTVKPTALMKYLLTLVSTPTGGRILDPFAGSCTTAVVAQELGRPCVCVELDPHYCEIGAARLHAREN